MVRLSKDAPGRAAPLPAAAGLLPAEWEAICRRHGQPPYRAAQVMGGIFRRGALSFDEMTSLPRGFRQSLETEAALPVTELREANSSADGTSKLLLGLRDGEAVECVLIPMGRPGSGKITLCVSSQVGCAVRCSFCASGLDGLIRNLDASEIVEQYLQARKRVSYCGRIARLVFMGMGEPLHNVDEVLRALEILTAPWGGRIGARKITVSTVGSAQGIRKLADRGIPVSLAVSLHAGTDGTRKGIVRTRREDLEDLVDAAEGYFQATGREVTFEYAMLDGVNDSRDEAKALARLLRGRSCTVNLIPYNRVEGLSYDAPKPPQVRQFREVLLKQGVVAKVRRRRGDDVNAACGQLRRNAAARAV